MEVSPVANFANNALEVQAGSSIPPAEVDGGRPTRSLPTDERACGRGGRHEREKVASQALR